MAANHRELLERARRELLDLSTRNRLLSIPASARAARIVHIHDELSTELFRLFVMERKSLSFAAGELPDGGGTQAAAAEGLEEDEVGLPPPDESVDEATGLARRHLDSKLQTRFTKEALQRRLLDIYRDARTIIEETGVNVLYLALGQLKWFEPDAPETPRFAPLLLAPADLVRKTAADRFHLKAREEEVEENLSLRAKLAADFGIDLAAFPETEDLDVAGYFAEVSRAVAGEPGWEVLPNAAALGFFSFAKFLMYRDLDPDTWPAGRPLLEGKFIAALLGDGFSEAAPGIPDEANLDELIPADRLDHVVDADGSQTIAIELVRQGRSLVIQGPPGTGKSQSITNIIATAVLDGRRVLFVAEKLAALEVVKRRLEREGLGDLCLELHSNKANKRAVLAEIGRTWKLGKPKEGVLGTVVPELELRRAALNGHCAGLHARHPRTGLTPFQVLGELVRLGGDGSAGMEIDLPGAESWSPSQRAAGEEMAADLAERLREIGPPASHPWRGVRRETVLPFDLPPLMTLVQRSADSLAVCVSAGRSLASMLGVPVPSHLGRSRWFAEAAVWMSQAPPGDRRAVGSAAWKTDLAGLKDVLAAGRRFADACGALGGQVTETAWEQDFAAMRTVIAARGGSLLRMFDGGYRSAVAAWRGVMAGPIPSGLPARLQFLDTLISGQRALREVRAGDALGAAAFGAGWRRERSDWPTLGELLLWIERREEAGFGEEFRLLLSVVADPAAAGVLGERLGKAVQAADEDLRRLAGELKLDFPSAFGVEGSETVPLPELQDRLTLWRSSGGLLPGWNGFFVRSSHCRSLGLGPLADALEGGAAPLGQVRPAYRQACYGRIFRELARADTALARFDGEIHSRRAAEFRELDRDRLSVSKYRVLAKHHAGMPNPNAGVGAVGILKSELERKRGHRPVRRLLREVGSVVQAIKPVFMMSPLSVAQFLDPEGLDFDLLVVDEASQVQPVDAFGAIARCRQMVVVGDSKQLPPMRFFARMTGDIAAGEEESREGGAAQVQDIESVLGLCSARGLPQTMLRWHYRSRHHSLIAVSNREFYESRLFIVPSPDAVSPELGLSFQHVPDGVFDAGKSGANVVEARAVCRAVIEHARRHPGLSLGVAAFSVRQQIAILDELEILRRENPETEAFFHDHPAEPFFVKNLENVQGDERDVIFISIGYGRDAAGFLAMRFGPLSNEGGERRLNVLISRAKRRCTVFASITADDIDLQRSAGGGVRALKAFLQFAQTGRLETARESGRPPESLFEESVRAALQARGVEVRPQVGVAGFFIDLAVLDPKQPGRYVLGIECDGVAYHASPSARDRDRLRQAILEDHGWRLHRIWSCDWFQRPEEQLTRTLEAIERARAAVQAPQASAVPSDAVEGEIERENPEPAGEATLAAPSQPYEVATLDPRSRGEPQALTPPELAEALFRILQVEAPLHEQELLARVKELWNLARIGSRLQAAVDAALDLLVAAGRCERQEGCLVLPGARSPVRNRSGASPPGVRKPDLLPPPEVRAAILLLIETAHGVRAPEMAPAVARTFGFKTTPPSLRELVARQVARLQQAGEITELNGLLQRKTPPDALA